MNVLFFNMETIYQEGICFEKQDFTENYLPVGEYENCRFSNCNFSSSSLALCIFVDCEFVNCNLSLVNLQDTAFRTVEFLDSKLLGLEFNICNDFGFEVSFTNCNLANSVFWKKKLKNTIFKECNLNEVDFNDCNLSKAKFVKCDLSGAVFERTQLIQTDFRTAYNYAIDPEKNSIKKAVFSLSGVKGLLYKYDIKIE